MNYRDCDYTILVHGKRQVIDCYTKEQVLANIRHENGCSVYRMNHKKKKAELIGRIKSESR